MKSTNKTSQPENITELAAFRLPRVLRAQAARKARAEDLTFSQLMRRAIRQELSLTGSGSPALANSK